MKTLEIIYTVVGLVLIGAGFILLAFGNDWGLVGLLVALLFLFKRETDAELGTEPEK